MTKTTLGTQDQTPSELYETAHWYACRTRARAEKKVDELLGLQEIETFLPLVERERQWADRTKKVAFPLFPGYVFAHFRLDEIASVLGIRGVVTVLRPNGYPTPVRSQEIESVRALVRGANESGKLPSASDYLQEGEEVVVTSGPFQDMRGVLIEERGRARVAVRIAALRQAASVELDRELLRPARAGSSRVTA